MGAVAEIKSEHGREVFLSQNERMQLISVLPQQGDVATVRQIRLLRDMVNLKPEERPKQTAPGVPTFPQPIEARGFRLTARMWTIITTQLEILEKSKKLPVDYLDLYEKFMGTDKEESS